MLIASVSDLHTDYPENRDAVVKLATEIHRRKADVVIVAGDLSHKDERIVRALSAFRAAAACVVYVPGNHDLWFDVKDARLRPELDSWRRYRETLPALAEEAGAHYLPRAPLVLDGVGIAGSTGWYDYSLMDPELRHTFDEGTLASKQHGGMMWSDARFIAFRDAEGALMGDVEVARIMERELEAQLEALECRDEVHTVVAVTHHQPFAEVVTRTGTLPWDFFNAFMGSAGLGEVIRAASKVCTAVYGHSHVVASYRLGRLRAYGTPLGYPRERRGVGEEALLATRIGWIEL